MIKSNKKIVKVICYCYLLFAICYLLTGCATAPTQQMISSPTFNINGATYIPLISICQQKNINWEYDSFLRKVYLKKQNTEIQLMVGSNIILINNNPLNLTRSIEFYKGIIIVPYEFYQKTQRYFEITPRYLAEIKVMPRKIVIDPGHGGKDPGAIGQYGLREKDIVLDVAKRLKRELELQGMDVILTRDNDRFIALPQRSHIANQKQADLFVSIHANASRTRGVNGFETYYLSNDVDDNLRALVSAENASLNFESNSFKASNNLNLKATLWDMIYTQNRAESIELAKDICETTANQIGLKILGVKGAPFHVLKNTQMPAVLVEVGFISNPQEERLFRSGYYRQQIAQGITEGILAYCKQSDLKEACNR